MSLSADKIRCCVTAPATPPPSPPDASLSPFLSPSDHQETAAAEHSDKFPSVSETPKQVQTAPEEEEEAEKEEGDGEKIKETTEEKSRGSN